MIYIGKYAFLCFVICFHITYGQNATTFGTTTAESKEEGEDGGIHVASWRFSYVKNHFTKVIFLVIAAFIKLVYHHFKILSSWLPETCLLLVVGSLFGLIITYLIKDIENDFVLTPKLFMLILLPPIVLDSAFMLHDSVFYRNLPTILLYAFVGTLINWILIGPSLYGISKIGVMDMGDLGLKQYLLFASFIVAVDPVAVLAIFQEVGVHKQLYFLVFGESLLNDAVTIVLSNLMKNFVNKSSIGIKDIGLGIACFLSVSLGGLAIGIVYGIITAFVTKYTRQVRVVEPMCIFGLAYMAYLTAEMVHWSGIFACISCGLFQSSYAIQNLSGKSTITVKYFSKMLSSVMETVIFMYLGIEIVISKHHWNTGFVLWTLFLCLSIRGIGVFGLTFLSNLFRKSKIIWRDQFILFYGGLRGAVCYAIAATLSEGDRKNYFMTATFGVIFFTVFIQGATIKPLVNIFKIKKDETICENMSIQNQQPTSLYLELAPEYVNVEVKKQNCLIISLKIFDEKYFRPFLTAKRKKKVEMDSYDSEISLENMNSTQILPSIVCEDNSSEEMIIYDPDLAYESENNRLRLNSRFKKASVNSQGSRKHSHTNKLQLENVCYL